METGTRTTATWTTETVTDPAGFAALEAGWARLHAEARGATPFQSHAWLAAWWSAYGPDARVVLVRRDDRLVAAAPLHRVRRGPVRVLRPLGGDQSDHHDVLVTSAGAAERLAGALRRSAGWDVLDLAEVRAGAGAELLAAAWSGRRWRTAGSLCQELPVGSMDGFVAGLRKSSAKVVKKKLRRIGAAPIASRAVPADGVPAAVDALLALHRAQWAGRGIAAEHVRPRFRAHLVGALTRMVAGGQAVVTEYTYDGRVAVVDVKLTGPDFVGTYLAGFDPALREHVDVATLMLDRAFREVTARGAARLDLLRGDEPYKSHWHATPARNGRLLLGRTAAARPYARLVLVRGGLAEAVKARFPRLRRYRNRVRSWAGQLSGSRRPGSARTRRRAG